MPNKQKHRGLHSQDLKLFAKDNWEILNQAVSDLSFLISKGYSERSSLKLVGDRYRLVKRQRMAVLRASCREESLHIRKANKLSQFDIQGKKIFIDGYNLLISIEVALSGGIILHCKDDCYRDIASIHGTYRKVEETLPALQLIGKSLQDLQVGQISWYLDKPISNSGRLKGIMLNMSMEHGLGWEVHLANNPDKEVILHEGIIISSDGWVLDHAGKWFNLSAYIIDKLTTPKIVLLKG